MPVENCYSCGRRINQQDQQSHYECCQQCFMEARREYGNDCCMTDVCTRTECGMYGSVSVDIIMEEDWATNPPNQRPRPTPTGVRIEEDKIGW